MVAVVRCSIAGALAGASGGEVFEDEGVGHFVFVFWGGVGGWLWMVLVCESG